MLKAPEHQVAGHEARHGKLGPLVDDSGRFYKPFQSNERGSAEVEFYTSLSSNTSIPDHIRGFFPAFYGTELVEASDGSGLQPHLVLQDLNVGRVHPSIMDIKIGTRTWYPQAPDRYFEKCLKKDRETSTLHLGFRLSGLKFYESEDSGYWKPDRKSVMKLSAEDVTSVLKKFVSTKTFDFNTVPDCSLASVVFGGSTGILSQLRELKAWFEDQTIFHFYSCSLLLMYDKEKTLNGNNPVAEVKMIDFAHVLQGRGVIDHNFLGGLCSLIKSIDDILKYS
ncbi:kinase [Lithospermum erythrorhizon]|uniref:Inositol polyphosphate multikinase n=1 Tax=Lithospermum erythrorhizon TaxID=34254 RepID=A0AAV3PZF2_LITER